MGHLVITVGNLHFSARWEAAAVPGLSARDPLVVAAALLGQAGTHRDDAGLLVLKP